jgi:hypothetical protein
MTVITTLISKDCCVFATDSFITEKYSLNGKDFYKVIEKKKNKIVCVKHFNGAMAYWGLAKKERNWSMMDFLTAQASIASSFKNPESFAQNIKEKMESFLSKEQFDKEIYKGFGIHFTAYEIIDGIQIPELFVIRNFNGTNYNELNADGIHISRETYDALPDDSKKESPKGFCNSDPINKHKVLKFLLRGGLLIYNNGFPELFNASFQCLSTSLSIASDKNILKFPQEVESYMEITSWPVKQVIEIQNKFIKKDFRTVGGDLHCLAITKNKEYFEKTNDKLIK